MTAATLAVRQGAGDFLAWWGGELRALVPSALREVAAARQRTIDLIAGETGYALRRVANGHAEPLATVADETGAEGRTLLAACLKRHPPSRWRYRLLLPDDHVLRDTLSLPPAAAENLREVVGFQLDKHTPFRRDQLCYDCRIVGAVGGSLRVDVLATRRDLVDGAVARLRAAGVPVSFVGAADDAGDAPLDLLPADRRADGRGGRRLNALLLAAALILAATAVWLPMDRDRQRAALLAQQVDQHRKGAAIAMRLRTELDDIDRKLRSVTDARRNAPTMVGTLDDLARLIPDTAWVSRLSYNDGTVRAVIHAPESSEIVRLVESSRPFADVRLIGAVRRDSDKGLERINLEFAVRKRAATALRGDGSAR